MKEEYKDFVGIYDESVPVELCQEFVKNYEEAKENRTLIDLYNTENKTVPAGAMQGPMFVDNENETQRMSSLVRKDEAAYIAPISSSIYPRPPVQAYFEFLQKCFNCYKERYSIEFYGTLFNDVFKIHKVRKSGGFHLWHYENGRPSHMDRFMVYMTYLKVPKRGGETEFLHQSLRLEPIVGRTLIWPAGYTHMHRGNPPLEGEKMYITGWFTAARVDFGNSSEA